MALDELALILRGESDRVEWKQSLAQTEEIFCAVAALANDLGGRGTRGFLVIGVSRQGQVVGLRLTGQQVDEEQQKLSNRLRSTKLLPTPTFDIEALDREGRLIFVVRIEPYPTPPAVSVNGVAWVRSGTTTVRATDADLQRLRERRPENAQPFDARPVRGATLADLDETRLQELHAAAREAAPQPDTFPPLDAWLTQREMGRPVGGVWTPNAAAVLVFGLNPQEWVAGALMEFVRYGGTDVDAPVASRRTIGGSLPNQLDILWAQIEAHVADVPASASGIVSAFAPQYPLEALKELSRNMVQHRQYEGTYAPGRVEWYEDRIEFSNPGGPFNRASEGEFGTHSDYRNPLTTRLLAELGYVERLGRGVRRVRKLLADNANPALEAVVDGFTRLVVRRRS